MISAKTTHIGLVRTENQDALGHIKVGNNDLFVVCDGVGGLPNGALASKTALDSILAEFTLIPSAEPEAHLQLAMQKAQKAVMKTNPKPLGTTLVALYLCDGTAYTGWCGDSRIYHFRENLLNWMSRDHNVLHDILNKGRSRGSMFMNPQALNRFFGREFEVKSDYYSFSVEQGDQLLLCSDGLSNFLMEPDIIHAVTQNSPQEASDLMERKLLTEEIGAPDNFTWFIIQI
ncbi:MAG: serine/threonine-protein phosphatase [Candidatus Marinimicrobia bacterium]|nr:serine/threonine-protein phosphatase [Candidatus Neomarinimicrobiota bacterium]